MADLPFMPLWVAKYDARTSHLSLEEDGAYMRLLRLSWVTPKCQLPADDAWLRRMLRTDEATFNRVIRPILDEFFYRADGCWRNSKLRECYDDCHRKSKAHREAGSKGGQTTARKTRKNPSSPAAISDPAKEQREGSMPEPEARAIKQASSSLVLRVRNSLGPGVASGGRTITDKTIEAIAGQWLDLGATEDQIVEVVRRQTELSRTKPLRSLRVLTDDIRTAIELGKPAVVSPRPEPLRRPPGKAGECLAAIIARHGEVQAAAWLSEAEWTEDEVAVPNEFLRGNVDKRFGLILGNHGFSVVARSKQPQAQTA